MTTVVIYFLGIAIPVRNFEHLQCYSKNINTSPTGWCRLISKIKNHVSICAVSYITVITATILLKLLKCVTSRVSHNKFYTLSRRRMKSSLAFMHEDSDGNFLCRGSKLLSNRIYVTILKQK